MRTKLVSLESQSRPEGEEKGSVGMCVAMHTPEVQYIYTLGKLPRVPSLPILANPCVTLSL